MPCSKYKSKQRALCFATKEWTDWRGIKKVSLKVKTEEIKSNGVGRAVTTKSGRTKSDHHWTIKSKSNGKLSKIMHFGERR